MMIKKLIKLIFLTMTVLLITVNFCYASNVPGGSGGAWDPVETHEEIAGAFKAYCQTTGLNTEHVPNSVNAIVKWDYSQLEKYATLANVDLEGLNAHIWYQIQQNKPLKFYFDSTGVTSCQKIYSEIVSDYNLQENTSKTISTKYFEDSDGNSCYCFVRKNSVNNYYTARSFSDFNENIQYGTYYRFTGLSFFNNNPEGNYIQSLNYQNNSLTYYIGVSKHLSNNEGKYKVAIDRNEVSLTSWGFTNTIYLDWNNNKSSDGYLCITYVPTSSKYYLSSYIVSKNNNDVLSITNNLNIEIPQATATNSNITYNQGEPVNHPEDKSMEVTTGDTTINNYITNNNTNITYNYDDDDEPPDYTNPYNDNPTGGNGNIDGDGNINFNFQMPDLNINWSLDNLQDKFPLSIPFDMIRFMNALDAEPQTPKFNISLNVVGNPVNFDIDLTPFDNYMAVIRNIIAVGYCIFLIVATRGLFKVY